MTQAPYDGAPEEDAHPAEGSAWGEQAEPGSVPLSVTLRNHRKGPQAPAYESAPGPQATVGPRADQKSGQGAMNAAAEEVNPLLPHERNPLLPPPAEPTQPETSEDGADAAPEPTQAPFTMTGPPSESWDDAEAEPYNWGGESTEAAPKRNPFA